MLGKLKLQKILWFSVAVLSLVAAVYGLARPGIYAVATDDAPVGMIAQDLNSVAAAALILFCLIGLRERHALRQLLILGLVSSLFYNYGLYVLEHVINWLYLLYMAIFGLSFYTIVSGVAAIRREALDRAVLPPAVRWLAAAFMLIVPAIFCPMWIRALLPIIRSGRVIQFGYSVFTLDLCFVMPAFVIVAVLAIRKKGLGILLAPVLFIKGATVLLPVALTEILKPRYGLAMDVGGLRLYLGLTILFLGLAVLCLRKLAAVSALAAEKQAL